MTDIVIVVDAQNSFCHPDGVRINRRTKTKKMLHGVAETLSCIALLIEKARERNVPVVYLCANEYADNVAWWNMEIHSKLAPREHEKIFWRRKANDKNGNNPSLDETADALKEFPNPHLLLCGFYSDMCVTSFALSALKKGLTVSFVIDCMYPAFDEKKQRWFNDIEEYISFEIDFSRVQFLPMSAMFPNANPPVPQ